MKIKAKASLDRPSVSVPRWLLRRRELSHGAKLAYAVLAQSARAGRAVSASVAALAEELGEGEGEIIRLLVELKGWDLGVAEVLPARGATFRCFLPFHPWMSEPAGHGAEEKLKGRNVDGNRCLSKFSLEQCLEYTARLKESGEPIRTVGGFARYIYQNGTHDEGIAAWVAAKGDADSGEEPPNILPYKKRG